MNEYMTVWVAGLSGLGLVIGSILYAVGGRHSKWIRRFLGSLVIATTVNIVSLLRGHWCWELIIIYPLLAIGMSFGYGGNETITKVVRRTIYALAVCSAGLIYVWKFGSWLVFIPHIGIGLWSVYLGVKSVGDAAAQEFIICMLLNIMLIFYPFCI